MHDVAPDKWTKQSLRRLSGARKPLGVLGLSAHVVPHFPTTAGDFRVTLRNENLSPRVCQVRRDRPSRRTPRGGDDNSPFPSTTVRHASRNPVPPLLLQDLPLLTVGVARPNGTTRIIDGLKSIVRTHIPENGDKMFARFTLPRCVDRSFPGSVLNPGSTRYGVYVKFRSGCLLRRKIRLVLGRGVEGAGGGWRKEYHVPWSEKGKTGLYGTNISLGLMNNR